MNSGTIFAVAVGVAGTLLVGNYSRLQDASPSALAEPFPEQLSGTFPEATVEESLLLRGPTAYISVNHPASQCPADQTMTKTALGLNRNVSALLSYALGWVSGLAVILIEKDDDFVRFHAMQSILTFGALTLLSLVFGSMFMFIGIMSSLIQIAGIALWILLMVKAYQGEKFMLPIIGEMAEQWAKKFGL